MHGHHECIMTRACQRTSSLLFSSGITYCLDSRFTCVAFGMRAHGLRARVSRHARANSDANALMRLTPACGAHHHAARDMSRVTFVLASHRVIVTARACSESAYLHSVGLRGPVNLVPSERLTHLLSLSRARLRPKQMRAEIAR